MYVFAFLKFTEVDEDVLNVCFPLIFNQCVLKCYLQFTKWILLFPYDTHWRYHFTT